jgi:hypothetical protein
MNWLELESREQICFLILRVCGIGLALSSLEVLAARDLQRDEGLLSWSVASHRYRWLQNTTLSTLLRYPNVLFLHGLRILGCAALFVNHLNTTMGTSLVLVIALTSLILMLRNGYGHDGADQMSLIIFLSYSLARLEGTQVSLLLFLWFIAAQSCLSYCVAGFAKLSAAGWRNGTFLPGILAQHFYGSPVVSDYLKQHPGVARAASSSVIFWECTFPVVMFVPAKLRWAILGVGIAFHCVNGLLMGLNSFVWAFASTYPAIMYCAMR